MATFTFRGTTISDWVHVAGRRTRAPLNKSIGFPNARGRDSVNIGGASTPDTSKTIICATEGAKRNALKETSASAVLSKITSLQSLFLAGTKGTLVIGSETHTDMLMTQFELVGDIRAINASNGTTYYIQDFIVVFQEVYS